MDRNSLNSPVVSVLMPVLNREELVQEAIRSIQNQTFVDWELILLDDGSTDNTVEVCRSYEAQDSRIRVYSNEKNVGVGETRSRLVNYASGKYIAHHDSDDISLPGRLAQEVDVLESNPQVGLVCGVTALLDDDGEVFKYAPDTFNLYESEQYPQDKTEMVKMLYFGNKVSNPTCMFRRSLIKQLPLLYGTYRVYEDWFFLLHLAHHTQILGIPKVLVKTRLGKNHQHLFHYGESMLREACRIKRDIYEFYKDAADSPIDYWLYRKSMATSLTPLARHVGSWKGFVGVCRALFYDPSNQRAWEVFRELSKRAIRKATRLGLNPKVDALN